MVQGTTGSTSEANKTVNGCLGGLWATLPQFGFLYDKIRIDYSMADRDGATVIKLQFSDPAFEKGSPHGKIGDYTMEITKNIYENTPNAPYTVELYMDDGKGFRNKMAGTTPKISSTFDIKSRLHDLDPKVSVCDAHKKHELARELIGQCASALLVDLAEDVSELPVRMLPPALNTMQSLAVICQASADSQQLIARGILRVENTDWTKSQHTHAP
jgi:hypothetical protein